MIILLSLLSAPVQAGTLTTGAAAGWDFRSDDLWSGVDVAVLPTRTEGFELIGRITPSWGFFESQPRLGAELGFTGVYPHPEATVRVGLVAEGLLTSAQHRMPLVLARSGSAETGVIPAGMGIIEFEYGDALRYTVGARAGIGSEISNALCGYEAFTDESCLVWSPGFAGGFTARMRSPGGMSVDLLLGPTMRLSAGLAW